MPISSSTIVHFTHKKAALKGILKTGFKIRYCYETIQIVDAKNIWAVPMVSFCDIPLSQVKDHVFKYGGYGIGLTKNWAKKKMLSPVQYISRGSYFAQSIKVTGNHLLPSIRDSLDNSANLKSQERAAVDILRYSKNYEGDLNRSSSKTVSDYRFYDEREWRFVPQFDKSYPMIVPISEAKKTKDYKDKLNEKIASVRLDFEPSDVKYIIVKDDKEISEFVSTIKMESGKIYSHEDTERLITRIITQQQIEDDF